MISRVYIVACNRCRNNMTILKAGSIGAAFKAIKKMSSWKSSSNNTYHECPRCLGKE